MSADSLEPRPRVVSVAGGRVIAWHEFGQADDPVATVLYCHGTPGTGYEALFFDEAARSLGLRIIALDRPGLGASDPVSHRAVASWVQQDVTAVLEHLDVERFSVLGFSGGGPHALGIAALLRGRVERVVLLAPYTYHPLWESRLGLDFTACRVHLSHLTLSCFPQSLIDLTVRALARPLVSGSPLAAALNRQVAGRSAAYRLAATHDYALQFSLKGGVQDEYAIRGDWGFSEASILAPVHLWIAGADRVVKPARVRNLGLRLDGQIHELPRDGHLSLLVGHGLSILSTALPETGKKGAAKGAGPQLPSSTSAERARPPWAG